MQAPHAAEDSGREGGEKKWLTEVKGISRKNSKKKKKARSKIQGPQKESTKNGPR